MHAIETAALTAWHDALAATARWQAWRGPLAALAAALLAAGGGRLLRVPLLAAAAAGIGAAAGIAAMTGIGWPPSGALARCAPAVLLATILALAVARLAPARERLAVTAAALAGGWLLGGMPRALPHALPPLLPWTEAAGAAAVLAAAALWLPPLGAGQVALASLSLAAALSAAHQAHGWVEAALVPAAALLGSWAAPGRLLWPAALAFGAIDAACVLASGDLQRLTPRPLEAAALAPLLALWLAARLAPRMKLAASGVGLAAATALVWIIAGGR